MKATALKVTPCPNKCGGVLCYGPDRRVHLTSVQCQPSGAPFHEDKPCGMWWWWDAPAAIWRPGFIR